MGQRDLPRRDNDRNGRYVSYKALILLALPLSAIMTTIIIFFFNVTAKAQSDHLRDSLKQQLQQLRLIVDTHSGTVHRGAATVNQMIALETRFEKQADRLMAGVKENSEAVHEIAELVLSTSDETHRVQKEVKEVKESLHRLSVKMGM